MHVFHLLFRPFSPALQFPPQPLPSPPLMPSPFSVSPNRHISPCTVITTSSLRNCFNTVAHSPGDIIENKIQTHLLLGQSYPCCQSRCHTHTTLTSTPKSDIVCWNRPSLYLFSRT